jgi:predicted PurR-regulated permease PerM
VAGDRWPPTGYWVRTTITIVLTVAVLLAVKQVQSILVLVLIAAVISVGLDPAVGFLVRRMRMRHRGVAVAVIFIAVFLAVAALVALVGPPLAKQIESLANAIPELVPKLGQRSDWIGRYVTSHEQQIQLYISSIPQRIAGSFGTVLGLTGKVGGFIFNVLTVAVLTVFFMASLPGLRHSVALLFPPARRRDAEKVIEKSVAKIGGYVSGNIITSAVCAMLAGIALLIMGMPYAVPLALWAGVADLIPSVGSYLGAVPAVLVAFTVSPGLGVAVLAYFLVYQQFENYVLVPRVMRNAVDLSSPAVLIATMIGASLAGFAGALLALPVAATVKVVLRDVWYESRESAAAALLACEEPPECDDLPDDR